MAISEYFWMEQGTGNSKYASFLKHSTKGKGDVLSLIPNGGNGRGMDLKPK